VRQKDGSDYRDCSTSVSLMDCSMQIVVVYRQHWGVTRLEVAKSISLKTQPFEFIAKCRCCESCLHPPVEALVKLGFA